MSTVYVAMVEDRHVDPEPEVFTTPEAAIAYARGTAQKYAHELSDYQEHQVDAWLFCAWYSCEGDRVWVVEKELRTERSEDRTAGDHEQLGRTDVPAGQGAGMPAPHRGAGGTRP